MMMCFGGRRRPRDSHLQWGEEDCLISAEVTGVTNTVDAGNESVFKGE